MMNRTLAALAEPDAGQMVDALNGTFGQHEHMRASHAKGFCGSGFFEPNQEAGAFSTSPLFAQGRLPAKVRFSLAGGNPTISDKALAARGMSINVDLPNKESLTLVMISAPMFFAASRESFVSFLEARRSDPTTGKPDPKKIEESNHTHLDSEAQRRWLAAVPPSASYATSPYFPVHTYLFAAPDGAKRPARWIFEPLSGRVGLTADEIKSKPDAFLEEEFKARLGHSPAEWKVSLILPEATDPLLNPTVAWPDARKTIEVGRFTINAYIARGSKEDCDEDVFDPTHLPTGIEPIGDPIFTVRSEAYAISRSRRAIPSRQY